MLKFSCVDSVILSKFLFITVEHERHDAVVALVELLPLAPGALA